MQLYRSDGWSRLVGADVEIYWRGQLIRAGVVDAVMPDGTLLWLAGDYHGSRALFESAEGYEVWASLDDAPEELYSAILCQKPTSTPVPDVEENL
jgi:hypothetical protein